MFGVCLCMLCFFFLNNNFTVPLKVCSCCQVMRAETKKLQHWRRSFTKKYTPARRNDGLEINLCCLWGKEKLYWVISSPLPQLISGQIWWQLVGESAEKCLLGEKAKSLQEKKVTSAIQLSDTLHLIHKLQRVSKSVKPVSTEAESLNKVA